MLKSILITWIVGMIVGFGCTLMSLFGGGSLLMEYLECCPSARQRTPEPRWPSVHAPT